MDQRQRVEAASHPGAAGTVFTSNGRYGIWLDLSPVDARAGGAKFDGSTDDSANIQSVIDGLSADGGGLISHPSGKDTVANIVLKPGVYYQGPGRGYRASGTVNPGTIIGAVAGVVVDTPVTAARNLGIMGVNVRGLGSSVAGVGIRFRDVVKGYIKDVYVDNVADEAVLINSASGGCAVEDVQVVNALLDRTRAALAGAVDIAGTDHWISRVEATASVTGAVTDANLRCAGFVWRAVNGVLDGVIGEISDIGVYDLGQLSTWLGCRADLNRGHGFVSEGVSNQYYGLRAVNNGQATHNTYENVWFKSTSSGNEAYGRATSSTANRVRYGVNDEVSSAANKNDIYIRSTGAATQDHKGATSNGSAWFFPQGGAKTLTVNSPTPSVAGYTNFITANTAPTTITNFTGAVPGTRIVVYCNDTNTTINHDGTLISLFGSVDKPLDRFVHYEFMFSGVGWREINPSLADVADLTTGLALKANSANAVLTGTVTVPDGALAIADTSGLQTALDAKAPLANAALTGTTTAEVLSTTGNTTLGNDGSDVHAINGKVSISASVADALLVQTTGGTDILSVNGLTGEVAVGGFALTFGGPLNHDGTTVGFYGATPVTQPAANPDTSGASLAALETEVNQLKALLRSVGLLAT